MTAAAYAGHFPSPSASGPQSPPLPPSIMMPVELYGFLISINQLHQHLAYGPRGHEFLELIRSTYAPQPTVATSCNLENAVEECCALLLVLLNFK